MLRVSQEPAWILHRRPFRDSSALLDILTPNHGRLALVARGGRKARSAGLLQPLQPLSVNFSRQRELGNLQAFESAGSAVNLQGLALWSAFYLNELLMRVLPDGDEHAAATFELYSGSLQGLASREPGVVLRRFEYDLLVLLGYALDHQAIQLQSAAGLAWDAARGLYADARGVPCAAVMALLSGAEDQQILATQPLLASMLQHVLGGRSLRTAAMLRDLVGLRQQTRRHAAELSANQ